MEELIAEFLWTATHDIVQRNRFEYPNPHYPGPQPLVFYGPDTREVFDAAYAARYELGKYYTLPWEFLLPRASN